MRALRLIPLPTVEELLGEIPGLLIESGELAPRSQRRRSRKTAPRDDAYTILSVLSPAWSNPDFEPELGELDDLERHFFERQIERAHRDHQLEATRPFPWVLKELEVAPLGDWTVQDEGKPWIALEVPCLTIDRRRAVLRGQRCDRRATEDFEHWFVKTRGRWTRA